MAKKRLSGQWLRLLADLDAPQNRPLDDLWAHVAALVEAGVGPLLWRLPERQNRPDPDGMLRAADMTARVLIGGILDAAEEILQAAGPDSARIVLLKGIPASLRHYPEPHLRTMGDIDLLVPPDLQAPVQSLLHGLGYTQRADLPALFFETHHHDMPYYHPERDVWVEVHRELFPKTTKSSSDPCFSRSEIFANTIPFRFRRLSATCFRDELHLLYTCAHWGRVLNLERGLIPLLDVVFLITRADGLDWGLIERWARPATSGRYLALMLSYLVSRNVIDMPGAISDFVSEEIRRIGRANCALLHRIIDRYLVQREGAGRFLTRYSVGVVWDTLLRDRPAYVNALALPLVLLFPPDQPDRLAPGFLFRRIRSIVRARRRDPEP